MKPGGFGRRVMSFSTCTPRYGRSDKVALGWPSGDSAHFPLGNSGNSFFAVASV